MSWSCPACSTKVEADDDMECPSCGEKKTSWTMLDNRTRSFKVTRRSSRNFECHLGADSSALGSEGTYVDQPTSKTEHAIAITKSKAIALHEEGAAPPPAHVLFVKLRSLKPTSPTVRLRILFEADEMQEVAVDPTDGEDWSDDGKLDVRVLFVYGDEDLPGSVAFPGLTIVEVAEASASGHAPAVEVVALRRKAQELGIQAAPVVGWNTAQFREGAKQYRQDELAAADESAQAA